MVVRAVTFDGAEDRSPFRAPYRVGTGQSEPGLESEEFHRDVFFPENGLTGQA